MPKNRLEAFSDGIIAIAITLLVLEIHIPDLGPSVNNAQMLRALTGLLPNFAACVISFLICAVWWVSHHNFIHDLHSVDRPLLWINNLFLMMIVFLPFPTGLLGHHPLQPVATAFYGLVCSGAGLAFWLMRWYATERGRLINTDIDPHVARRRLWISAISPISYLVAAAFSLLSPGFSMVVYFAIPAYFAVGLSRSGNRLGSKKLD